MEAIARSDSRRYRLRTAFDDGTFVWLTFGGGCEGGRTPDCSHEIASAKRPNGLMISSKEACARALQTSAVGSALVIATAAVDASPTFPLAPTRGRAMQAKL